LILQQLQTVLTKNCQTCHLPALAVNLLTGNPLEKMKYLPVQAMALFCNAITIETGPNLASPSAYLMLMALD
jgi:hypothetical protein